MSYVISILLAVQVGSKVFRMGLLVYSKRPTLTPIVPMIRQA